MALPVVCDGYVECLRSLGCRGSDVVPDIVPQLRNRVPGCAIPVTVVEYRSRTSDNNAIDSGGFVVHAGACVTGKHSVLSICADAFKVSERSAGSSGQG